MMPSLGAYTKIGASNGAGALDEPRRPRTDANPIPGLAAASRSDSRAGQAPENAEHAGVAPLEKYSQTEKLKEIHEG